MRKVTADAVKLSGIMIIGDNKEKPEMDLAMEYMGALDLKVVPSLGHSTLIRLPSLHVPQPCFNTLSLPILRRQFQPEDELNGEGYLGVRSSDMIAHQILSIAPLQLRFQPVKVFSYVPC